MLVVNTVKGQGRYDTYARVRVELDRLRHCGWSDCGVGDGVGFGSDDCVRKLVLRKKID